MGIARDVGVQAIHIFPAFILAHQLKPTGHVEETGARGIRVRHDDVALVDRLCQVGPRRRQRQLVLAGFDRVEADGRDPGPLPDPLRWVVGLVVIQLAEFFQSLRRVALEIAFVAQHHQAGGGQAPDDVGLGVGFFGHQLRGHDTGGIAHPLDVDVGIVLFEGLLEHGQFVGFDGGVDQEVGLGESAAGGEAEDHQAAGDNRGQSFQ